MFSESIDIDICLITYEEKALPSSPGPISRTISKQKPCFFSFKPCTILNSGIPLIATFSLVLSCGYAFFFFLSQSRPSRYLCLPLLICACDPHCLCFFLFCLSTSAPTIKFQLSSSFSGKLTSHEIVRTWELQRTRGTVALSSRLDDHSILKK